MAHVRVRPETGQLYFDFQYLKVRCREQSTLKDTPENRKLMERAMIGILNEIRKGTFRYREAFPSSKNLKKIEALEIQHFQAEVAPISIPTGNLAVRTAVANYSQDGHPLFDEFAQQFVSENESIWKRSGSGNLNSLYKWMIGSKPVADNGRAGDLNYEQIIRTTHSPSVQC